jgi:hypothetical protein
MKEIYQTLSQIGQYTSPLPIIGGTVLYGVAALLISLIIMIILRKKILIPRSHKALKIIAWSWFLIIPLLAGFFGMKWGFFHSLRKDIRVHTEAYVKAIPHSFDEGIATATGKALLQIRLTSLDNMSTDQVVEQLSEVIYTEYNAMLDRQAALKNGSNVIVRWALKLSKGRGVAMIMKDSIRKLLREKLGLDEDVSKELMASRIGEVLKTGFFAKIALIQADHFLKSIQKGVVITFLMLLCIPLLEIGIAHYLLRKEKKKKVTAAAPEAAV